VNKVAAHILFDPLIGNMKGPAFLLLYILVIIAAFLAIKYGYKIFGKTPEKRSYIPAQPDPYEIAYLRAGPKEVTELVVYGLLCRGYLESAVDKKGHYAYVFHAKDYPRRSLLAPVELAIFDRIGTRRPQVS
jgi:uncharacterized protein (TIGR04222 family)